MWLWPPSVIKLTRGRGFNPSFPHCDLLSSWNAQLTAFYNVAGPPSSLFFHNSNTSLPVTQCKNVLLPPITSVTNNNPSLYSHNEIKTLILTLTEFTHMTFLYFTRWSTRHRGLIVKNIKFLTFIAYLSFDTFVTRLQFTKALRLLLTYNLLTTMKIVVILTMIKIINVR